MVRIYSFQTTVRNPDGDVWGQMPPSGVLKLFEQAAVTAAADTGYDRDFHREHGTAWIIRRMTLLIGAPARLGDRLELTTWLSHMARVRGYREYRLENLSEGGTAATGIAEWVYIDREKVVPKVIPREVEIDFDMPGAPLGSYDAPEVEGAGRQIEVRRERTAEWYECDSMGHVNNAVYPDWLDAGVRAAMEEAGWSVAELKAAGRQLRGEYMALDYKRAALPGDRLAVVTRMQMGSGRLCRVSQVVEGEDGAEVLTAMSVYGWADRDGRAVGGP
jgi:acyl-CoA thioesterase FadM